MTTAIKPYDAEQLVQASHSAGFLTGHLSTLTKSENPLLAEIGLELLESAAKLQQRLERLTALVESETNAA